MKPTDESAHAHGDFAGDESTSVMGVDLLSSLTERSRRIDVAAAPVPEPEISIVVDEAEPVTTVSAAARPQLRVVDREYPELGDEESTMMMDEPEPTTVAVRTHRDRPSLPPAPAPVVALPPPPPPAPVVAVPLPVRAVPDPPWAAELSPRVLDTIRVAPRPVPPAPTTPERAPHPAAGSRRLSALAAIALGVAGWTVGLGHHEPLPPSVIAAPVASVSSVLVTPWGLHARAATTLANVRAALASLLQSK